MILLGEENDGLLKTDIMEREEGDIIFFLLPKMSFPLKQYKQ